ncbi:MAG: lipid II flippase MurJ, partial [Planctomycetota bacterium]
AAVVYEGGAFTEDDTGRVVGALNWYALAIASASLTHVLTRAFYAKDDTSTPMRVGVLCVVINIALSVGLMWTGLGERALALGTGVGAVLQAALLLTLARRRLAGGLLDPDMTRCVARIALCSGLMAAGVWGLGRVAGPIADGWWGHAARLALMVGAGAVLYAVAARVSGAPELGELFGRSERVESGPGGS